MTKILPQALLKQLPEHDGLEAIPQAFSDSTHHLWRLRNDKKTNPNYFLKVCANTQSPFWQIMQRLFTFDLKTEITDFAESYPLINQSTYLKIPALIKADVYKENAYVLTSEVEGSACNTDDVNDHMVVQLARHLAELHSHAQPTWGKLTQASFDTTLWAQRLKQVLEEYTQVLQFQTHENSEKKWGGVFLSSEDYLKQALTACDTIEVSKYVPMMPDLRWDQFLQQDNKLTALVDLDAFVYAPRELDFVILEYILLPAQLAVFQQAYSKHYAIPDLHSVRAPYRLLLFYMQILGETELEVWMNQSEFFDQKK